MKDARNRFEAILTPDLCEVVGTINQDFFERRKEWLRTLKEAGAGDQAYKVLCGSILSNAVWMLMCAGVAGDDVEQMVDRMFETHTDPKFAAALQEVAADKADFMSAARKAIDYLEVAGAEAFAKGKAAN